MPSYVHNPMNQWIRTGTTLSPRITGDSISTTGDITTETATVKGLLTVGDGGAVEIINFDGTLGAFAIGGSVFFGAVSASCIFRRDLISFSDSAALNTYGQFDSTGFGVGVAPTTAFDVENKAGMSAIGGHLIKLTNKTGANSVKGALVKADTANDDAVVYTAVNDTECIGVFLESGVADGSEAWIVVSGIAEVLLDDNIAAVRGNWMATGQIGLARTGATPAAAPAHFEEIGHCIQSVAAGGAGTFALARCVIHFL